MPGEIVSSLQNYDEQINVIQNIPLAGNTILQVFSSQERQSNVAMNDSIEVPKKKEKTPLL